MCIVTENLTEAYRRCQEQLRDAGLLIALGVPGVYGHGGVFEDIIERFEQCVTRRAKHLKPEVIRFPAILSRKHYLQTTHIENFPDLMGSVHSFTGNERDHVRLLNKRANGEDWTSELTPTDVMLTPAACYPLYPTATGTLPEGGRTVDLRSFVFRHEPSPDPARSRGRANVQPDPEREDRKLDGECRSNGRPKTEAQQLAAARVERQIRPMHDEVEQPVAHYRNPQHDRTARIAA